MKYLHLKHKRIMSKEIIGTQKKYVLILTKTRQLVDN